MAAFRPRLDAVLDVMSRKGYRIFHNDHQAFDLNLVGIRSRSLVPNRFDDWVTVFYRSHGRWIFNAFPATTDPGLYWLGSPMNRLGTAILKEGQHRGMYALGTHKGYRALQQKGPVTVIRDFDRDARFDFDSGREETGTFGINLHRASRFNEAVKVDKWSAGCQVLCDPLQFNYLMEVCEKGKAA
ncbi:MAG: hypothetical protein R3362_05940, partial [Rhodothermales bacterium]|nr:hypothetical protein [Rhodothermales bacterium]